MGIFSIFAAQNVGPAGRVVALEPSPTTAESARFNVKSHAKWCAERGAGAAPVDVMQVACGDGSVPKLALTVYSNLSVLNSVCPNYSQAHCNVMVGRGGGGRKSWWASPSHGRGGHGGVRGAGLVPRGRAAQCRVMVGRGLGARGGWGGAGTGCTLGQGGRRTDRGGQGARRAGGRSGMPRWASAGRPAPAAVRRLWWRRKFASCVPAMSSAWSPQRRANPFPKATQPGSATHLTALQTRLTPSTRCAARRAPL